MAISGDVLGQELYDALIAPVLGTDVDCPTCSASGTCQTCGGTGLLDGEECPECKGVAPYNCVACNGTTLQFDATAEGIAALAAQKAFAAVIVTHIKTNLEISGADLEVTGALPHVK